MVSCFPINSYKSLLAQGQFEPMMNAKYKTCRSLFFFFLSLWFPKATNDLHDAILSTRRKHLTFLFFFFFSDLLLLACNWSTMGDRFFVCHHLAALYAYGYVLVRPLHFCTQFLLNPSLNDFFFFFVFVTTCFFGWFQTRGVLPYFANFRLISELSTPFVNQRWVSFRVCVCVLFIKITVKLGSDCNAIAALHDIGLMYRIMQ